MQLCAVALRPAVEAAAGVALPVLLEGKAASSGGLNSAAGIQTKWYKLLMHHLKWLIAAQQHKLHDCSLDSGFWSTCEEVAKLIRCAIRCCASWAQAERGPGLLFIALKTERGAVKHAPISGKNYM